MRGGHVTDERGQELYNWVTVENYKIENGRHGAPTFFSNRGIGWVDLQFTRNINVKKREVKEEETLSDHRWNEMKIEGNGTSEVRKKRYDTKKANWDKFKLELKKWKEQGNHIGADLEQSCERLEKFCKRCCEQAIPIRRTRKRERVNWWWNDELKQLKTEVNKARTNMQRETQMEERTRRKRIYQSKRTEYKKKIKETKEIAFQEYIREGCSGDPWKLPYKMIRKGKERKVPCNIKREDGAHTRSTEETEEYLINKYFTDDQKERETARGS